jgi:hypothetical protein
VIALVITQGCTRSFSVAPLLLCRFRTIGVCDPGGSQTKRYLTGRNGKKLLVTGTPARHGPIGVDAGDAIGFALGAEKPGDLLYITGDTFGSRVLGTSHAIFRRRCGKGGEQWEFGSIPRPLSSNPWRLVLRPVPSGGLDRARS